MLCDGDVRRDEWGRPNDAGGERVGASTATDLAYLAYSCSSRAASVSRADVARR